MRALIPERVFASNGYSPELPTMSRTSRPPTPSLDAYWGSLPQERREALDAVRQLLFRIWPGLKEDMSLNMPTYLLNGTPLCALASQKHYMAIYIMPYDLLDAFRLELIVYDRGRSCIRFKRISPELLDLLDRIVKYVGTRFEESVHHGQQRNAHTFLRHEPPALKQP
jgi:uncharacterized protein YdhG (YjbR/CyaY superfamily)